ncbi:phenoloxidase-activating factor 2 [Drosophila grimshawi]|nr:phenoloxidase-activating factor 2 [Drosophila grimshawi]
MITDGKFIIQYREILNSSDIALGCYWLEKCCSIFDKLENVKKKSYSYQGCGYRNPEGVQVTLKNTMKSESQFGEFPWMVRILASQYPAVNSSGGSLLSPKVVLTTAHYVIWTAARNLKVIAGEWDTKIDIEILPHEERAVERKIVHDSFNRESGYYDIALLILTTPFNLAEHIGTICLPYPAFDFTNKRCFVTGWGKRNWEDMDYPHILKKVDLPFVSRTECQKQLRKTRLGEYFNLHESFVCAGGEKDNDACVGDGGAPLVCPIENNSNRYMLAGMVSWGLQCGTENVAGVYTNIQFLRGWIEQQLRLYSIPNSYYTIDSPSIK